MSDKIQLKVKFEGSPKVYHTDIFALKSIDGEQQKEEFIEQIKKFIQNCDYETPEKRMLYFIYNKSTQLYIITYNDLVSEIKGKKEETPNSVPFIKTSSSCPPFNKAKPKMR